MDDEYYAAVIRVFNELYEKGLIYRGVKMINWDPKAKTALSDEEVIHKQTNSKLYYVRYLLDTGKDEYITIATPCARKPYWAIPQYACTLMMSAMHTLQASIVFCTAAEQADTYNL